VTTPTPPRRLAATFARIAALCLTAALLASGCTPTGTTVPTSSGPDASAARSQLDALTIGTAHSMTGYSRLLFSHWNSQGNGCDTREVVLKRDGTNVKADANCHPTSGEWLSPYDNKQVTDPDSLDVDHMVPLADAWRTGADTWTDARRSDFANDLTRPQLLAVSATTNRAKGDQDPSQWKPPNKAYWCEYAKRWIAVKHYWELFVTAAEKSALIEMLGSCQWQSSAART